MVIRPGVRFFLKAVPTALPDWTAKRAVPIPPCPPPFPHVLPAERIYMKGNIEERACELAAYIVENRTTVREAAKKFGISKSTVHMDIT